MLCSPNETKIQRKGKPCTSFGQGKISNQM